MNSNGKIDDERIRSVVNAHRTAATSALANVERWLSTTEIKSLLMFADRLFLRAAVSGDDVTARDVERLLARSEEALDAIDEDLRADNDDTTAVLIIQWALKTLGRFDLSDRIGRMLDGYMHQLPELAEHWPEFERSTYFYWASLMGRATARAPSTPPVELSRRVYHDLHLLMFQTAYGMAPIARDLVDDGGVLEEALGYWDRLQTVRGRRENPDLVAEALLVEMSLLPFDVARMEELVVALLTLQQLDGGFAPSLTASLDARHHTACVAAGVFRTFLSLR